MKRLLVVANKGFEADALMAVLANADLRSNEIAGISSRWPLTSPATNDDIVVAPRCTVTFGEAQAEVWCIQDLMRIGISPSNTEEKSRVLTEIFRLGSAPHCVVAFGTAAMPKDISFNGSVAVGTRVFLRDPYVGKQTTSDSRWDSPGNMGRVLASEFPVDLLQYLLATQELNEIQSRFLKPPNNPAETCAVVFDPQGVALSSVNITDYRDYAWADLEGLSAAIYAGATAVNSVETTHGVIRVQSDAPFLFVSGVANRVGHIGEENPQNAYAQKFASSYNAGVTLAWILPKMASLLN